MIILNIFRGPEWPLQSLKSSTFMADVGTGPDEHHFFGGIIPSGVCPKYKVKYSSGFYYLLLLFVIKTTTMMRYF